MTEKSDLGALKPGEKGRIIELFLEKGIKRRLQDMGMIKGARIECVGRSPLGDPSAYLVKGAVIAIRSDEYKKIAVEPENGSKTGAEGNSIDGTEQGIHRIPCGRQKSDRAEKKRK